MDQQNQFRGGVAIPPAINCSSCGDFLGSIDGMFEEFFDSEKTNCKKCGTEFDCWKKVKSTLHGRVEFASVYSLVGGYTQIFTIDLIPDQIFEMNLGDFKIPAESRILALAYTPQGGTLYPVELNGSLPWRHGIPKSIPLLPHLLAPELMPEPTTVLVAATWVFDEVASPLVELVSAVEFLVSGRLVDSIVPANVSVEAGVSRVVLKLLEGAVSKKKLRDFSKNSPPYSQQLNVLLPGLLQGRNLPTLPEPILKQLNILRSLRNKVAHGSIRRNELSHEEVVESLAAAMFGFRYHQYILARL